MGSTPESIRYVCQQLQCRPEALTWGAGREVVVERGANKKLGFHFKTYQVKPECRLPQGSLIATDRILSVNGLPVTGLRCGLSNCLWHNFVLSNPQYIIWDPSTKTVVLDRNGSASFGFKYKVKKHKQSTSPASSVILLTFDAQKLLNQPEPETSRLAAMVHTVRTSSVLDTLMTCQDLQLNSTKLAAMLGKVAGDEYPDSVHRLVHELLSTGCIVEPTGFAEEPMEYIVPYFLIDLQPQEDAQGGDLGGMHNACHLKACKTINGDKNA
nr:hypothetical protein BaRGS_014968 [Batillaria attramentaria]